MSSAPWCASAGMRTFLALRDILAQRWTGVHTRGPDWLCPEAVQALIYSPQDTGILEVALLNGMSARALPRSVLGLRIRPTRQPVLQAQSRPPSLTLWRTRKDGTATALVRDRLNPERCFLLTCGHVVAPDEAARYGEAVRVGIPGGISLEARLTEWQPTLGTMGRGQSASELDAALVEVHGEALKEVLALPLDWLPNAVTDEVFEGAPVALRCVDGPQEGTLCALWAGGVALGDSEVPNYFLKDGISYATTSYVTQPGDSGSAIWTSGDKLLGMHVGALDDELASSNRPSAVMVRVRPALDWYCVKPFTRSDPATITPSDWPARSDGTTWATATSESVGANGTVDDELVLARTLWGEARGEGTEGMKAVAWVVVNRLRKRYRGRSTITEVCMDLKQFSCWNEGDPNRRQMLRLDVNSEDPDFKQARKVARAAIHFAPPFDGQSDPTYGARHYVASSLPERLRPDWLLNKQPCVVIGRHEFYNDIL